MGKDMMSKIRAGDVWKALSRVLDEFRIPKSDYDVLDRRPHPHLTVRYCGSERFMSFPCTPHGHGRAPYKYSSSLRRMLKEMQMAALGTQAPEEDPSMQNDDNFQSGAEPEKNASPIVRLKAGQIVANSRDVAAYFEKLHKHVLRDIRKLVEDAPACRSNFGPNEINDLTGSSTSHYDMDRTGFMLLAMGFTGPKALKFKIAYIEQFDAMEAELRSIAHGAVPISNNDQQDDRHFGISKMTIHKVTEIERHIKSLEMQVNSLIVGADARVAVLDYVTVFELLYEGHAIQKGRRSLNLRLGAGLRKASMFAGRIVKRCPITGRQLFQRDFAEAFMAAVGNAMIRDHNARQTGQAILNFGMAK